MSAAELGELLALLGFSKHLEALTQRGVSHMDLLGANEAALVALGLPMGACPAGALLLCTRALVCGLWEIIADVDHMQAHGGRYKHM